MQMWLQDQGELKYLQSAVLFFSQCQFTFHSKTIEETFLSFTGCSMCYDPNRRWDFQWNYSNVEFTAPLPILFTFFFLVCVPAELVFACERRCNKKRSCGRHKCGELCCVVCIQCVMLCSVWSQTKDLRSCGAEEKKLPKKKKLSKLQINTEDIQYMRQIFVIRQQKILNVCIMWLFWKM